MCFVMKTLLEARIKTKKITSRIRIQSITVVKPYIGFITQKRIESEKMETKMEKLCRN